MGEIREMVNCFCNAFDNEKSYQHLIEARRGNKTSQKLLYEALSNASRGVTYRYYGVSRNIGLSLCDLEEELIFAFMTLLNKYDIEKGTIIVYFRYIYAHRIRDKIREAFGLTNKMAFDALGVKGDYFDNDVNAFVLPEIDDTKSAIYSDELVTTILSKKSHILTEKEAMIVSYVLESYTFKEIAIIVKLEYSKTISRYKSARKKIIKYINANLKDYSDSCNFH